MAKFFNLLRLVNWTNVFINSAWPSTHASIIFDINGFGQDSYIHLRVWSGEKVLVDHEIGGIRWKLILMIRWFWSFEVFSTISIFKISEILQSFLKIPQNYSISHYHYHPSSNPWIFLPLKGEKPFKKYSRRANKHINSRNNDTKLKPQWAQREIT